MSWLIKEIKIVLSIVAHISDPIARARRKHFGPYFWGPLIWQSTGEFWTMFQSQIHQIRARAEKIWDPWYGNLQENSGADSKKDFWKKKESWKQFQLRSSQLREADKKENYWFKKRFLKTILVKDLENLIGEKTFWKNCFPNNFS